MHSASNNVTISGVNLVLLQHFLLQLVLQHKQVLVLMQTQTLLQVMMVQIFTLRLVMKKLRNNFW